MCKPKKWTPVVTGVLFEAVHRWSAMPAEHEGTVILLADYVIRQAADRLAREGFVVPAGLTRAGK